MTRLPNNKGGHGHERARVRMKPEEETSGHERATSSTSASGHINGSYRSNEKKHLPICAECNISVRNLFEHYETMHPADPDYTPPPPTDLLRRGYWPMEEYEYYEEA